MSEEFHDYVFKVIIIGEPSVGKTSLLNRYVDDIFSEDHYATIGVEFKIKTLQVSSGKRVKLQLWDTSGSERYRAISKSWYRGSHAIVFVFDLSDYDSFARLEYWLKETDDIQASYKILIGNKADLPRVVPPDLGPRSYPAITEYLETCAKTGENVGVLFAKIAEDLAKKMEDNKIREVKQKNLVKLGGKEEEGERRKCCGGTG